MSKDEKAPEIAAGDELVERCPFGDCAKRYTEAVATDAKHKCPACNRSFNVMTFQE